MRTIWIATGPLLWEAEVSTVIPDQLGIDRCSVTWNFTIFANSAGAGFVIQCWNTNNTDDCFSCQRGVSVLLMKSLLYNESIWNLALQKISINHPTVANDVMRIRHPYKLLQDLTITPTWYWNRAIPGYNGVTVMTAHSLVPCVSLSSAIIVWHVQDLKGSYFLQQWVSITYTIFQGLECIFRCVKVTENVYVMILHN